MNPQQIPQLKLVQNSREHAAPSREMVQEIANREQVVDLAANTIFQLFRHAPEYVSLWQMTQQATKQVETAAESAVEADATKVVKLAIGETVGQPDVRAIDLDDARAKIHEVYPDNEPTDDGVMTGAA